MSKVGDAYYLTTVDGAYVLDQNRARINIPLDDNDMPNTEGIVDRLGVFLFSNPEALQPVSSNRYLPTEQSGDPQVNGEESRKILTQTIELSKVSVADEMVDMIIAQRGFQISSRVVQAADEVEDIVSNLRK
jgi:flagellar basal-body rod protein FlgG